MKKKLLQYASCLLCGLAVMAPLTTGAKAYVDNKDVYKFEVKTTADTQTWHYRYMDLGFNEQFQCEKNDAKFDAALFLIEKNDAEPVQVGRAYGNQPVNSKYRMCYRYQFINLYRPYSYFWRFTAKNNEDGQYALTDNEFRLCSEED